MTIPHTRSFLCRLALAAAIALPLGACGADSTVNRGVESVHQPVVSYTSFVIDLRADSGTGVSTDEKARLNGWLDSLGIGYGDSVALAGAFSASARADIAEVLGQRGMLVRDDNAVTAGTPPYGSVRVVVRRAIASVPGCPNWQTKQENTMSGSTSSNFGCAVNSNIAAMIANPEDLVRGQTDSNGGLLSATSNRAIKDHQAKPTTGAGGLVSLGGN